MLGVTSKVCEGYKMFEKMSHLNPVLLEFEPYILHCEQLNISLEPPWTITYLKAESARGSFSSQSCFEILLGFSYDCVQLKPKPPWCRINGP
jgi:hypothetical protein